MSLNTSALHELASIDHSSFEGDAVWLADPPASQSADASASLIDLARLRFGAPSVDICDVCHTVNLNSARLCKCCAHKLPAFYVNEALDCKMESAPARPPLFHFWALAIAVLVGQFAGRCREGHRSFATHFGSPIDALK
jgi:hypothetical protein